ncbi:MAG: Flp pilus assembly protein CpaB [Caulobacteraceae bacterium]
MNSVRLIILGVALLAGMACVALLARSGAHSHPIVVAAAAPPPPAPTTRVLTAKHDLAVGDTIGEADIQWQSWPISALNPVYITDGPVKPIATPVTGMAAAADKIANAAHNTMTAPSSGAGASVIGAIVRQPILTGEPIIAAKVVHAGGAGIMAVTLDSGMRAMALPLSAESAAGGFILPGDHVDVVLTRQEDSGPNGSSNKIFTANTVLNNVKVLAIDQNTGVQKGASVIGATGTVEVTEKQAETLLLAKSSGTLTFVLRSYADAQGPATPGDMRAHANTADANIVHVFRNGVSTPVMVTR